MPKEINLQREISKYQFKSKIKIQFHQVDAVGILYNVQYLIIFENARFEYLNNLGLFLSLKDIIQQFPVMTASHKIDYINSAEFADEIEIYTRVSQIGTSSLIFDNVAVRNRDLILAKATTSYVLINPITKKSTPIPEEIRKKFIDFEKGNITLKSIVNENN
jgi:acyl-CoA thioester hydrolase